MRLNRALLGWGLFLVLLGGIPLAVRQGLLTEDTVREAWRLWPLLLIAAGLGLLLRGTPLEVVGGLISAAVFGLILGSVIATGSLPVGCGGEASTMPIERQSGTLASAADVEVRMNCGNLNVATAPGDAWALEGFADDPLDVEATSASLEIRSQSSGFGLLGDRERWTVSLPADPTIDVDLGLNAGDGAIDLAGAHVGRLSVQVNAGSLTLDLGEAAAVDELDVQLNAVGNPLIILPAVSTRGSIEGNAAGNIRLCPPAGAGLRLTVNDNVTARNNYAERGLVRSGDAWETPNWNSAAIRIELETRVNAGNFNLEPEGTCGG